MATTTPNFGWSVPTSTDYVKDGAVAIETLGDAIDASLVDLKGGTTGQVLSKNTNTDMDFVWVTPNDADAIQNTIVDAKGDLITATGADVPARLGVGSNGQVLTADSTTATGLKWATPAGGDVYTQLGTANLTGASTITISGLTASNMIFVVVSGASSASTSSQFTLTFNGTSSGYDGVYNRTAPQGAYSISGTWLVGTLSTGIPMGKMGQTATDTAMGFVVVSGANTGTSNPKAYWGFGGGFDSSGNGGANRNQFAGVLSSFSAISSVSLVSSNGNFDAGTLTVWGA